jgi:sugar phosphate isomerase/epimerase
VKFALFSGSAPEWTPDQLAAKLVGQGWNGVEWRVVDQKESAEPGFWAGNRATFPFTGLGGLVNEITKATSGAGLEHAGIAGYVPISEHANVDALLAATAALGAGQVRVQVPKAAPGTRYNELFAQAKKDAAHAAERARHHGVKAIIQIHHGNIVSTSSATVRLLEGLDPAHIGIIHDLGNLTIEGREGLTSYTPGLEILGAYLAHVHIKNAVWKTAGTQADGTVDWKWEWAPLRSGMGDVPAYFKALKEVGYDAWITVENFLTEPPLEKRIAGDLAYLKACAAAAGYTVRKAGTV